MFCSFKSGVLIAAAALGTALGVAPSTAAAAPASSDTRPAADLIVRNARIWTVNPAQPQADAVAVLNGRIAAVGPDAAVMPWRGPGTRVVDAKGGRLLPGFNDAHVHFSDGGAALAAVQLTDATSLKEFVKRIADYASHAPKGEWIRNGEWDETKWSPAKLPTRQEIDAVTPDNPVALDRYDGHMILVNSKVLTLAGITSKTPDPPGRRDRARCDRPTHRRAQGRGHRIGATHCTAVEFGAAPAVHRPGTSRSRPARRDQRAGHDPGLR